MDFPQCNCHFLNTPIRSGTEWRRILSSRVPPHRLDDFYTWLQDRGLGDLWAAADSEEERYRRIVATLEAGEATIFEIAGWNIDQAQTIRQGTSKQAVQDAVAIVRLAKDAQRERAVAAQFFDESMIRRKEAEFASQGLGGIRILDLPRGSVSPVLHTTLAPVAWYYGHGGGSFIFSMKNVTHDEMFEFLDFGDDGRSDDRGAPEHDKTNFRLVGLVPRSKHEYLHRLETIFPAIMDSLLALLEYHTAPLKNFRDDLQNLQGAIRTKVSSLASSVEPWPVARPEYVRGSSILRCSINERRRANSFVQRPSLRGDVETAQLLARTWWRCFSTESHDPVLCREIRCNARIVEFGFLVRELFEEHGLQLEQLDDGYLDRTSTSDPDLCTIQYHPVVSAWRLIALTTFGMGDRLRTNENFYKLHMLHLERDAKHVLFEQRDYKRCVFFENMTMRVSSNSIAVIMNTTGQTPIHRCIIWMGSCWLWPCQRSVVGCGERHW